MTDCETRLSGTETLPPELLEVLAKQPPRVARHKGAGLVSEHIFPVSPRTLEAWPLPTRHVNGKAVIETKKLFEVAYAKLAAAPLVMGGRRRTAETRET